MMNIYETINYINSFSKLGAAVKDLSRFERIMNALGNPQDKLKIVHVAGTNGKGSTVRMLSGALTASGYKTGEFTSPYIRIYNDRIRIDGRMISDDELCSIVSEIKPVLEGLDENCSQFEISTAIAFIYYAAMGCDVVVLEAGLGGLLDCTNIIRKPMLSVITSVSLDHTKILGDTLEQIAKQKAGIIKEDCPVVLACSQKEEAYSVIKSAATIRGSRFATPDLRRLDVTECAMNGSSFTYKNVKYDVSMLGRNQIENALTVIEAAEILRSEGFSRLTCRNVYIGIKNSEVPSRCQVLNKDKPYIIIDGAHNPDGMRALAEFVKTVPKEPKIMVCGMMEDKDWKTALGYITKYIDRAVCVDGFAPKTVFAPKLAEMFREAETASLRNAVSRAASLAGRNGMVIIGGSLYLAAAFQKNMP